MIFVTKLIKNTREWFANFYLKKGKIFDKKD